jgi:hypothetical protein
MYYNNGSFYQGSWEDGLRNGLGEEITANGEKYVGEWSDGEKCGSGKLFVNNEVVADGIWNEDRFQTGRVKTKYY